MTRSLSTLALIILVMMGTVLRVWAENISHAESVRRIAQIDEELKTLPVAKGLPTTRRLGFQSHLTPSTKWVRLHFDHPMRADTLVLVPAVSVGTGSNVAGFGLPRELDIEIESPTGREHLRNTPAHPGTVAPVIIPFSTREVTRVTLTALVPWQSDDPAVLALSEIFVLDGPRNIAPLASVAGKEPFNDGTKEVRFWDASNLIDHETPLGIPVKPAPQRWKGYASRAEATQLISKTITLDLGSAQSIEELRLVPAHLPDVPKWTDFGFPERFELLASDDPAFTTAATFYNANDRYSSGPGCNVVVVRPRNPLTTRYVQLRCTRLRERARDFLLALAEFQIISNGQNIARGLNPVVTDALDDPQWNPAALTDGEAPGGTLIEWPEWLRLLEQRQRLETERATLLAALPALREAEQRLHSTFITIGISALVLIASLWFWKRERQRKTQDRRLRERLARDLHDEIGSNLGSIALLTGFAQKNPSADVQLKRDLATIEQTARESASSMRDMVKLLHLRPGVADGHWLDILRALAQRLLPGHQLAIHFDESMTEPDVETRRELYLICKEALHNIARHAKATHVEFSITQAPRGLCILIRDNGIGFDPQQTESGNGLGNMRERSAQMRATLDIQSTPDGTTLQLHVPL